MMFKEGALLISLLALTNAANILILSALPSFSHHMWNSVLGEALGARGHNVSIFSPYFVENPPKGLHYITADIQSNAYDDYAKQVSERSSKRCAFLDLYYLAHLSRQMCYDIIETAGFHQLLNYPNDAFDLIIHDFTGGPCVVPFVHKFKPAPLIIVTPYSNPPFLMNIIGGHDHTAYVPHIALRYSTSMTFWQRFMNFLFYAMEHIGREYILIKELDYIMPKYFGQDMPSISNLEKRTALAFTASNPVIDELGPLSENIIPVGGIHIRNAKPLPQDLDAFISSSKKGSVLFSLGSSVQSKNLPLDKQKLFIDIFSEFSDYNFLWKFESNLTADELPPNVWIRPWVPQSDVLAHPNLKGFITHGGLLSTLEAIWRGVPMIVIPHILDQILNMHKAKKLEIAEGLELYSLSYNTTRGTLRKILENPKYMGNIKKLSTLFKDQKEPPLERAIWWVEWLLRNPENNHSRPPIHTLGVVVGNSLDVIALLTLIITIPVIILLKLLSLAYKRFLDRLFISVTFYSNKHEKQS